jgi:hypothetical protein
VSYLGWSGQCLVQTSKPDFDTSEFLALIAEAGMNWAFLYAPWLSKLIGIARNDVNVLSALKGLVEVTYTGAALNPSDEAWLVENGVKATVSTFFIRNFLSYSNHFRGRLCMPRLNQVRPTPSYNKAFLLIIFVQVVA